MDKNNQSKLFLYLVLVIFGLINLFYVYNYFSTTACLPGMTLPTYQCRMANTLGSYLGDVYVSWIVFLISGIREIVILIGNLMLKFTR